MLIPHSFAADVDFQVLGRCKHRERHMQDAPGVSHESKVCRLRTKNIAALADEEVFFAPKTPCRTRSKVLLEELSGFSTCSGSWWGTFGGREDFLFVPPGEETGNVCCC